jgi:hypothetical protein
MTTLRFSITLANDDIEEIRHPWTVLLWRASGRPRGDETGRSTAEYATTEYNRRECLL